MNELPAASLELEEIRSVFRAILARHIEPSWFESTMFAPDVTEALGLVLRNQRDRFMTDYYDTMSLQYPEEASAVSFTWRYVLDHIAYDNQEHNQLWRVQYNDSSMRAEPASIAFNQVLEQLITNLPPASIPSSNEYRTYDANTYDTLRQEYSSRLHAIRHQDIPDLIGNTGVADSDEEDFVSATRRRAPTVPWHRSGRHRVTDDQKKARAQRQAQIARETPQQREPTMVRRPRSPIIAGMTLETMVQHPDFFDERQVSNQRQYELGLPPIVPEDGKDSDSDSPDQQRYGRAIAYLLQSREPSRAAQVDDVTIEAQFVQQANEDAEEYASRRYYKDDPNNSANPRRMPQTTLSHLPSATAVAEPLPPRTVLMEASTMELIPRGRELQSYTDLVNDNDRLLRALTQAARDTEPDWPTEQTYALPTPKRARMVVRHRSPPTSPTIVQMVSAQEEPSHGIQRQFTGVFRSVSVTINNS